MDLSSNMIACALERGFEFEDIDMVCLCIISTINRVQSRKNCTYLTLERYQKRRPVFTARCYMQSAVLPWQVVRTSVCPSGFRLPPKCMT